jgi:hypothetical protein
MQVLSEVQPAGVDLLGDISDCYHISRYDPDPGRRERLQEELDQTAGILGDIRKMLPKANIRYSAGNHEDRLRKYLCSKAPGLDGLRTLKLRSLLNLDALGISFHDYHASEAYKLRGLTYFHGHRLSKASGGTARLMMSVVGGSVICGHSHRLGVVWARQWDRISVGIENGCLCSLHPGYLRAMPDWQQGFTILRSRTPDTVADHSWDIYQVPIFSRGKRQRTCVVWGKEFRA